MNRDSIAKTIMAVGLVIFGLVCVILDQFVLLFFLAIPAAIVLYLVSLFIISIRDNFEEGDKGKGIAKICASLAVIAIILYLCFGGAITNADPSKRCTICRKPSTDTFQGYPYCHECYKEAIIWAVDDVSD